MTKALIVGGGVAGPVAAMALERAGIESTVFEAYPRGATDVGAFLSFAVNGVDALRAIGADASVRELGFPTSRMVFTSGSGKRLGEVANGGKLSDGTVTHTIKRADLYRVLQDEAARRGADVRYGKRLVDAENRPDGTVVARFEDGTEDTGDLLIGCDGIHSRTRSIIDPAAPGPRYVPVLNVGGYAHVDDVAVDFDPDTYHMVFGKRAFFGYAVTPTGEIWWFANPPRLTEPSREQVAAITDAQWRAELRELYEKDASPAARIVAATPGELSGFTTYDMPPVPTWRSGAMIVIGDAAHATSPAAGQGASMAIEDAVVLAQCLRDAAGVPTAFRIFESTRRERVERMVAHGHRSSNSKAAGPVGRVIRDLMLPRFLKKMSEGDESAAFMFDHHIDWDTAVAA